MVLACLLVAVVFFCQRRLEVFRDRFAVCMDPQHLCNVLTSLYHQLEDRKIGTDIIVKLIHEQLVIFNLFFTSKMCP